MYYFRKKTTCLIVANFFILTKHEFKRMDWILILDTYNSYFPGTYKHILTYVLLARFAKDLIIHYTIINNAI